ncbi:hypothetical protein AH396_23315 [Salmonella enterica subsp. enterica]|nr:hypothetical protein [Salmonella enterica subsp. enterica]EDQ9876430.1 hypothetical protein [Salmonella enterica subsp. enterica]
MATLKDHQQAMVDLLASGSGIPASASRLAHAMHDVLGILLLQSAARENATDIRALFGLDDATTPGLNDKALAADVEVCRPKATPAERRVKELQNTINQLRASNAKLKQERDEYKAIAETHAGWIRKLEGSEQAGCRKPDTQVCEHERGFYAGFCADCGTQRQETKYRD